MINKMKKYLLSIVMVVLGACTIQAASVDLQQAAQQARDFMSKNFSPSSHARRAAQTIPLNNVETGQSLVYAFNVEGGGFVVVAGDDCVPAILGYSEEAAIDPSDMPDGMKALFAQYQQEMQLMKSSGQRAATIPNLGAEIPSLMPCKWGQRAPYYYMCPLYVPKKNQQLAYSLTGCVATAMAQIMYYHKHPAAVTELPGSYYNSSRKRIVPSVSVSKTLEWDKMLPTYGDRYDPKGTQEQHDAVAKLLRLVGQSVCMKYTPNLSLSNESGVLTSLVNVFNYDASTIRSVQRADYTYNDWIKMIYQELASKRPVYYSGGSNTGGHAYVVDGYSHEDFFYINWGWYDKKSDAFRLSLCNPSKKYEGGGSGTSGYYARQTAIIGIQPATAPQHIEPVLKIFNRLMGKYSYQRASANENFDISGAIRQQVSNDCHFGNNFDYGAIVKNAAGQTVQKLLPLNDDMKGIFLRSGRSVSYDSEAIHIGASLGDGTYTLQFLHRVSEKGEWKPFVPTFNIMFKIQGNKLLFDSCPDWLTAKMEVEKQAADEEESPHYKVTVTLQNKSTDKSFQRSLMLLSEDEYKQVENYGFAALLGPGETQTYTLDYAPNNYVPSKLYIYSYEDCATLGSGVSMGTNYQIDGVTFEGTCNLDKDLKLNADKSYVLKADDSYEVSYTLKNTGTKEFKGYVELVDSVGTEDSDYDFEENRAEGLTITLKPGESKVLKMAISDEGDDSVLHKISLVRYDADDQPVDIYVSRPFYFAPVFDLSFSNVTVTPTEAIDNDLADFMVKGNAVTVSGKVNNPEETAFVGSLALYRYIIDYSQDPQQDEDGNDILEPDQTYTKTVTIPAKGSIDFSQQFDLQNLVKDKKYSVVLEFKLNSQRQSAGEVNVYYSDAYLLNDGTTTGIDAVERLRSNGDGTRYYDLHGRRISGRPTRGIYIKGNSKVLMK